jgi:hypothetical protein
MTDQLGRAQKEGQEMVVVKAPDPVAARRLQHVLHLHFTHQVYVSVEEVPHQLFELCRGAETQPKECPTEVHERHLVARTVVNPGV